MTGLTQQIKRQFRPQRASPRRTIYTLAALMTEERKLICFAMVINISTGGAKLLRTNEVEIPDHFTMLLSRTADIQRMCTVVWRTGQEIGIRFLTHDSKGRRYPKHIR